MKFKIGDKEYDTVNLQTVTRWGEYLDEPVADDFLRDGRSPHLIPGEYIIHYINSRKACMCCIV